MSPRRTLIFDFDGTLADTLPRLVTISNRLSAEYGYRRIEEEDIDTLRRKRSHEVLRWLRVPLTKVPTIARRLKAELYEEMHLVPPIGTVRTAVAQLSQTHTLGIVTSNSVANVRKFLAAHRMPYFSFVRSSAGLFGKTPVLRRLMKKRHLMAAEMLYIGDETRDVEAARACGIDTVAVSWGGNDTEQLATAQPWKLIHRPEELVTILSDANNG